MELKRVNKRRAELLHLVTSKKKALQNAPKGYLRVTKSHGADQFYVMQDGENGNQKYLSQKDIKLAAKLAQKSYDQKVLRCAEQELKAWEMLAQFFPKMTVEEVYETLSPARQKLVTPVRQTDEEFRKQWESVECPKGVFSADTPYFVTDRGEQVRSKSEQLIANLLYRLCIPYRYEYPLKVMVNDRETTWHPDFLILDVRNRKEYYLEHLGMLDDQKDERNYARSAFWKMKVYEENGIYEGKNMIYTFETGKAPLDISYVEIKLRRILNL